MIPRIEKIVAPAGMIPLSRWAKHHSINRQTALDKIRQGVIKHAIKIDSWYFVPSDTPPPAVRRWKSKW